MSEQLVNNLFFFFLFETGLMWFCKILCLQVRFSKYNHNLIHIMLNNAYIIGIK